MVSRHLVWAVNGLSTRTPASSPRWLSTEATSPWSRQAWLSSAPFPAFSTVNTVSIAPHHPARTSGFGHFVSGPAMTSVMGFVHLATPTWVYLSIDGRTERRRRGVSCDLHLQQRHSHTRKLGAWWTSDIAELTKHLSKRGHFQADGYGMILAASRSISNRFAVGLVSSEDVAMTEHLGIKDMYSTCSVVKHRTQPWFWQHHNHVYQPLKVPVHVKLYLNRMNPSKRCNLNENVGKTLNVWIFWMRWGWENWTMQGLRANQKRRNISAQFMVPNEATHIQQRNLILVSDN